MLRTVHVIVLIQRYAALRLPDFTRVNMTSLRKETGLKVPQADSISLAGPWRLRLDPGDEGASAGWADSPLKTRQAITLPGTTDLAGIADRVTLSAHAQLHARQRVADAPALSAHLAESRRAEVTRVDGHHRRAAAERDQ